VAGVPGRIVGRAEGHRPAFEMDHSLPEEKKGADRA
jgi:hypothetical protein